MGASEITHAGIEEFDLDKSSFVHLRNKFPVIGKFWLPPELLPLVRERIAWTEKRWKDQNPNRLAMLTRQGQMLVNTKAGSDSIAQAWTTLRTLIATGGIEMRTTTFYDCRRFCGHYFKMEGGTDMGQTALSHTEKTILGKNYATGAKSRNYAVFIAAQKSLHELMTAANVFVPIEVKKTVKAKKKRAA
jgi:hypothetical protein